MTIIDFPCLQKDISFWSSANDNNSTNINNPNMLAKDMEKFLNLNPEQSRMNCIVTQPKSISMNNWLDENQLGDRNGNCNNFNIMSPVLKETPNSNWLADGTITQQQQRLDTKDVKETREADLTTSLWLATSSSEPFTCMTRSTNDAAAIEWPEILYQTSPNVWLHQRVERSDIDHWLAKNIEFIKKSSASVFDKWIQDPSKDWRNLVQNDESSTLTEGLLDNWMKSQQGSSSKAWIVVGNANEEKLSSVSEGVAKNIEFIKKSSASAFDKWIQDTSKDWRNLVQNDESSTLAEGLLDNWMKSQQGSSSNAWIVVGNANEEQLSSVSEGVFDNWMKSQSSSKAWSVQESSMQGSGTDMDAKWLCNSGASSGQDLEPSKNLQGMDQSSVENRVSSSLVEQWLCLAASDNNIQDDEEDMVITNDDESSIAILEYRDNDSDFVDIVDDKQQPNEQEESKATSSFWLF